MFGFTPVFLNQLFRKYACVKDLTNIISVILTENVFSIDAMESGDPGPQLLVRGLVFCAFVTQAPPSI